MGEWMYGDAKTGRLAAFNPLRWSGAISFADAMGQLEKAEARPIAVKVPAGFSSKEQKFATKEEAIAFIKSVDPETARIKTEEVDQALVNAATKMEDCDSKLSEAKQRY